MRVTIIGPYPPPYDGGISIHIKRIKRYLDEKSIDTLIYNESKTYEDISRNIYSIKSYKKFLFLIPFLKADIFHFHSINIKVRVLLGFYKIFRKNIILTIHGESAYKQINNSNIFMKNLLLNSFKKIDRIICVNSKIVDDLEHCGMDKRKLICIPAYISPIEDNKDFEEINYKAWDFISSSKFLLSANGQVRFNNDEDLYGLDLLIELVNRLKHIQQYKDIRLIIAILNVENQNQKEAKYYNELKDRIDRLNLKNDILMFEVIDTEFYPILKKSKLFFRPTNADGDAVSIREALYYKVPSIVSDIVKRPEGAILFKTRLIDDLLNKTIEVIDNYDFYRNKLNDIHIENYSQKLFETYKEVMNDEG